MHAIVVPIGGIDGGVEAEEDFKEKEEEEKEEEEEEEESLFKADAVN